MTHLTRARFLISTGRILLLMSFVALASAWFAEIRGGDVLGLTQQHLFFDALALAALGIGCLLDSILHAKTL